MKEFWDIDTYIAGMSEQSVFNMNKLFKKTITIKDVEKFLGVKLARAGKYDRVEVVCSPWVDKNGDMLIDYRKERGRKKYYKVANNLIK